MSTPSSTWSVTPLLRRFEIAARGVELEKESPFGPARASPRPRTSTPAIFTPITMSQQPIHISEFTVESDNVVYTDEHITPQYDYRTTEVTVRDGKAVATPRSVAYEFRRAEKPKLGLMLVGWGGNNGCTTTASILMNKMGLSWNKEGVKRANYFGRSRRRRRCGSAAAQGRARTCGSLLRAAADGAPRRPRARRLGHLVVDLAAAMGRAKVLDYELQAQLRDHMSVLGPLPSVYYPDFIAANQGERADNALPGADKQAHLEQIRRTSASSRRRTASTRWWCCGRRTPSASPRCSAASTTRRRICSRRSPRRRPRSLRRRSRCVDPRGRHPSTARRRTRPARRRRARRREAGVHRRRRLQVGADEDEVRDGRLSHPSGASSRSPS